MRKFLLLLLLLVSGCTIVPENCVATEANCSLGVEVFDCRNEEYGPYMLLQLGERQIEVLYNNKDPITHYAVNLWVADLCNDTGTN